MNFARSPKTSRKMAITFSQTFVSRYYTSVKKYTWPMVYQKYFKALPIVLMILLAACSSRMYDPSETHMYDPPKIHPYKPSKIHTAPEEVNMEFFKNAQTKIKDDVIVTAAAVDDEESKQIFGVPTVSRGVEPVWVKIVNNDNIPYVFFPIEVDNFYYSPREAARKVRFPLEKSTVKDLERQFSYHSIPKIVGPGQTISGFVYALPEVGVKDFRIHLVGPENQVNLYFVLPVPGVKLDIENLHIDQHINQISLVDTDGSLLYEKLSELPCCTSNEEEDAHGDPLNLVIIGHLEDFLPYFLTRGWEVTEDIHISSVFKEIMAFLLGSDYKYSPISALYFDGQKQDVALQKPRANIYARNHFRLWLTDMSYNGEPIWVGQISRDIGVSFTTRHWWLSTHDIDPDIDEARNFFVQDMLSSHGVRKFGYIRGMQPFPEKEPLMNFMEQPIFTDGLRAVFLMDVEHTPITDIELFHWEWPEEYKLDATIKWEPGKDKVEDIQIGDSPAR